MSAATVVYETFNPRNLCADSMMDGQTKGSAERPDLAASRITLCQSQSISLNVISRPAHHLVFTQTDIVW